ncbi:MAG: glutathione S-transferase family protein [Rhodospirillaceae bacterium]|nr:glutathione S-transferase family protein [Rhodospirillaceae bacterium]
MITIFGGNNSRATRNIWVLEELGVPYEQKKFAFAPGQPKPAELLAANPAGKVPAMADSDGNVAMAESFGINLYLAQRYGAGKLYPTDWAGQAKCIQWTMWVATEVENFAVGMIVEKVFKPEPARDIAVYAAHEARLKPALKYLDEQLAGRSYLVGATFTIADLNVACVLGSLAMVKFDWTAYPNAARWLSACQARDAAKKVAAMPRP